MNTRWEALGGAAAMGLGWAVGWGITGGLLGMTSLLLPDLPWRVFFEAFDAPLPALAIPGACSGLIFSGVLGIAERDRPTHEVALPRGVIWGALAGFLTSLIPLAMVLVGLARIAPGSPGLMQHVFTTSGWLTPLSAVSGCVSLMISRAARR